MKILVTGGAGFIGSYLVKKLEEDGHQVKVLDLKMGYDILDNVGFLFKEIDVVYHLAALTRPQESFKDPVEFNRVNVEGTLKVLINCRDYDVKRLIFVSSASVYGKQDIFPLAEDFTLHPMSPYAITKQIGEEYCKIFGRLYKLEFNIVRPFNVYGKGQNPDGGYAAAVPKFIDQLSKRETPRITGKGEQFRDFVYVEDVVDLMVKAAQSKVVGETFNVGSGAATSINQLYSLVSKIMHKDIKPEHIAPLIDPDTLADITKAKTLLGWEPKFTLEEGLIKTIYE